MEGRDIYEIHIQWKVTLKIKVFRIFRNDVLVGVTSVEDFIERSSEKKIKYRVEAVSLRNEVIAKIETDIEN